MKFVLRGGGRWLLLLGGLCAISSAAARPPVPGSAPAPTPTSAQIQPTLSTTTQTKPNSRYYERYENHDNNFSTVTKKIHSKIDRINILRDASIINQTINLPDVDIISYNNHRYDNSKHIVTKIGSSKSAVNHVGKIPRSSFARNTSTEDKNSKTVRRYDGVPLMDEEPHRGTDITINGTNQRKGRINDRQTRVISKQGDQGRKAINRRAKRNQSERSYTRIRLSEHFPGRIYGDSENTYKKDEKLFKNFLKHSIDDLKTNEQYTQRKYVRLDTSKSKIKSFSNTKNTTNIAALKDSWPNSLISTKDEYENYHNYTSIPNENLQDSNDKIDFDNNWQAASNQDNDDTSNVMPSIQHYSISTNQNKPVIHQVLSEWSDNPHFDQIKDTLHNKISNKQTAVVSNQYSSDSTSEYDYDNDGINENYPTTEKIVYIRPKPTSFYSHQTSLSTSGDYMSITSHPTSNPHDLFNRPLNNLNYHSQNVNSHPAGPSTLIVSTKPGVLSPMPIKVVAPTSSYNQLSTTGDTNLQDDNDPVAFDNFGYISESDDEGTKVTSFTEGGDCPTVFVTINNTMQKETKEGCADIHLVINSNVLHKNVLTADPVTQATLVEEQYDPVEESQNSYPLVPIIPPIVPPIVPFGDVPVIAGTNSLVPLIPVYQSAVPSGEAAIGNSGTLSETGITSITNNAANSNPGNFPGVGSPPVGPGNIASLAAGGQGSDGDDEEDSSLGSFSSIGSWVNSAAGVFAYMTLFNPFNYGMFSLFLAPLVVIAAAGTGVAALMVPWAFPALLGRQSKKMIYLENKPDSHWKWDEGHQTWNWASYPNSDRDWNKKDPRIVSEGGGVELVERNYFQNILFNLMKRLRKWVDDRDESYLRFDNNNRVGKRKSDLKENYWKKRRK